MSSINKKEIEKFSKMADEWWDPSGKFKPLHKFNPIRIQYIKENIIGNFKLKNKKKPLDKINILDIGCGGGLLSEPMTRLGANITGIDASSKNINIAKHHAKKNNLKINYICSSPEKLKIKKKFDVILNMEIVEHVDDINFFINSSSKLLKKNGLMFVATLNKTLKSYIFAIVGAEYVLRWLPIGTHDWEKFVRPEDLKKILSKNNLKLEKLDGMNFNIIKDEWSVDLNTSTGCDMLHAFETSSGKKGGEMHKKVGEKLDDLYKKGYNPIVTKVDVTVSGNTVSWSCTINQSTDGKAWVGFTSRGAGCGSRDFLTRAEEGC